MKTSTNRWFYAGVGVVVMLFAGLIYAWSTIARPIAAFYPDWTSGQLSLTFTICMISFCFGGLYGGLSLKKRSAKINLITSGILFLSGFFIASRSQSLIQLYIGYGVFCGFAAGLSYTTTMATIAKYFPDKPGLISGVLLMGFGMGSFIIGKVYQAFTGPGEAFRQSFLVFGIILFVVMVVTSFFMRNPDSEALQNIEPIEKKSNQSVGMRDFPPKQMLKKTSFWLYAIWSILIGSAGLAFIAQASGIVLEVSPTMPAGTVSSIVGLISIFNGIGRVILGSMYDKIGRQKTMIIIDVVFLSAIFCLILAMATKSTVILVAGFIISGLGYGGLTPTNSAFVGDYYGRIHYPINLSIINMTLLVSSFGGTIAGVIFDMSGSYFGSLIFMAACIAIGSIFGLIIKKPGV